MSAPIRRCLLLGTLLTIATMLSWIPSLHETFAPVSKYVSKAYKFAIDIMNFANKGIPLEDPECVRCSACVQSCPTGVLQFGRLGAGDEAIYDSLPASPVLMRERIRGGAIDV